MAKRLTNPGGKAVASKKSDAAAAGASELDVLAGELHTPVAGEQIVVHEYGFFEGARLLPLAKPLMDDLQPEFSGGSAPSMDRVFEILIKHSDVLRHLVARAVVPASESPEADAIEIRRREKGLETLNDQDGELMLLLWWQANSGFFIRRLLRNAVAAKASGSATEESSTT